MTFGQVKATNPRYCNWVVRTLMQGQAKGPLKELGEWLLSVDTAKYERAARRREEYALNALENLYHYGCVGCSPLGWVQPPSHC